MKSPLGYLSRWLNRGSSNAPSRHFGAASASNVRDRRTYPSYQPVPLSNPDLIFRALPAYHSALSAHSERLMSEFEDLFRLSQLAQAEARQHQEWLGDEDDDAFESVFERIPRSRSRRDDRFFDVFEDLLALPRLADSVKDNFRTEMKEEDKEYVIEAKLPSGVTKDNLELKVENHLLTLSATVRTEKHKKRGKDKPTHKEEHTDATDKTDTSAAASESSSTTAAAESQIAKDKSTELMKQEPSDKSLAKHQEFVHYSERSYVRMIELPENASEDGIVAKFEDQVLRIHIPKLEHAKTHKITIE